MDRENLIDDTEQEESKGRKRAYADWGNTDSWITTLLSVLGSLSLTMTISKDHRWDASSHSPPSSLILPVFTLSSPCPVQSNRSPWRCKIDFHCREGNLGTAESQLSIPVTPLPHGCLLVWSPLGILMPFPSYPDCAQAAKSNSEEKWSVRFRCTNAASWFLSHTDKPQAVPKKSQWHI